MGRRFISDILREPKEQPNLQRLQIPDDCPEALAQWRRVMELQTFARSFFENWRERWEAAVETAASNLGLFGVSLLEWAGTMAGKAAFFSSKIAELEQTRRALHKTPGFEALPRWNELLAEIDKVDAALRQARAQFSAKEKIAQIALDATGAAVAIPGDSAAASELYVSMAEISDAFNQLLGSTNASNFVSNSINFGSVVGQFAIDLGKVADTIAGSVTTLVSLGAWLLNKDLDLFAANPALKKFLDNLGPVINVIETVVNAGRGVSDGLKDIKDLKAFEERYETTIARRNEAFRAFLDLLKECKEDDDEPEEPMDLEALIRMFSVASFDPNDIIGPAGTGAPDHFMRPEQTFYYTILFENLPTATAPAQEVIITHQLDANLDFTTFEVGPFGWQELIFLVPPGQSFYETRIDMTGSLGYFVDFSAGIDFETGIATWTFISIDPLTGDLISDALAGFLPPNMTSPEGEGFVEFSVRPREGTGTGDVILAQASIVFDANEPIITPIYVNKLDDTPLPVASIRCPMSFTAKTLW